MIKFTNLSFSYGKNIVFENFNLELPDQNIVSILGHNGAGKTTLVKLIAGVLLPNIGEIENNYDPKEIFVFSNKGNLYENMSLKENIKFLKLLKGIADNDQFVNDSLSHYLTRFKMKKHYNKKISELSSGLRTRAILISGLIFEPELLLLDEPTNTVDPYTRQLLSEIINELCESKKKIIIVTHDLEFCYELSETNIIIDEGDLLKVDDTYGNKATFQEFKDNYLEYTEGMK